MEKKYKAAYSSHKNNARKRGIDFCLTYQQWIDWLGQDIDRRGRGRDNLQMKRFGDKGPYALDNIKKGVPKENGATYSNSSANRWAEAAKRNHENMLNALMAAPSLEDFDYEDDLDDCLALDQNGNYRRPYFVASRKY